MYSICTLQIFYMKLTFSGLNGSPFPKTPNVPCLRICLGKALRFCMLLFSIFKASNYELDTHKRSITQGS